MTGIRVGEVYTEWRADLTALKSDHDKVEKLSAKSGKASEKSYKKGFRGKAAGRAISKDINSGFNARKSGLEIGRKMGAGVKSGFKAASKGIAIGAVGAAATGAALGAVVKKSLDTAREIRNLSNVAGVGAQSFQEITFAASKFGVEQDKVADILKDVNDKFGDFAQTGAGPLADFFENIAPKVGLTEQAFRGLSSDQALGKYIKALEDANVSQQDMTFYLEAVASDATALLPIFKNNGTAMKSMAKEANALGIIMSDELVDQGAAASDALAKLGKTITGNVTRSIVEAAPAIEELTNKIIALIPEIVDWASGAIQGFIDLTDAIDTLRGKKIELGDPKTFDDSVKRLDRAKAALDELNEFQANKRIGTFGLSGTSDLGLEIKRIVGKQDGIGEVLINPKIAIDKVKGEIDNLEREINEQLFKGVPEASVSGKEEVPGSGSNSDESNIRRKARLAAEEKAAKQSKAIQDKELDEFRQRSESAKQALLDRIQAANDLYEASRTPQEQYIARLTELAAVEADVFLADAAGGAETFSRLRVEALEELSRSTGDYEDAITQLVDASSQGLVSAEDFAAGFQSLTDEIEPAGTALERLAGLSGAGLLDPTATAQARDAIRDSADYLDDIAESKVAALELQAREIEGELILAELRGSEVDIEGLQRRLALIGETIDLINQGVDPDTAEKDAGIFVGAQDQARAQGELKSVFKGAFRAALDGNFESFLSNKLKNAASNMFDRALDRLLDGLLSGLGGLFGGGRGAGFGGILSAFGGAFADGGVLQRGKFGLVGENGPELISAGSGSLRITPPEDLRLEQFSGFSTAGLESRGSNQSSGSNVVMNVSGVKDLGSFVKSQGTIEADLAAAMRRAQADY